VREHTHTKKGCCRDKGTKESDKKKGRNYGKEHTRKERSRVLPEGPIRNSPAIYENCGRLLSAFTGTYSWFIFYAR